MADYYAYDAGLPCKNPNCKSHGQPHPNCRCYSHNAEGGEVSFCSQDRAHNVDCEYFKDGGLVSADDLPDTPSAAPVPNDDLPGGIHTASLAPHIQTPTPSMTAPQPAISAGQPVPEDDQPVDYESPEQQFKTVAEGVGQGLAGPLSTWTETHLLGVNPEDIAARQAANPYEHGIAEGATFAGSMLTGVGEAGLIAKAVPEFAALGKAGSAILRGAIETGLFQGGDEITDAMLGKGDPEAPVSSAIIHIGTAALLGGLTGGVFNILGRGANKGLQAIENAKLGTKANNLRIGLGLAAKAHASGIPEDEAIAWAEKQLPKSLKIKSYTDGIKLYYGGINKIISGVVEGVGATVGSAAGGIPGAVIGDKLAKKYVAPTIQKLLNRPLIGMNKLIMPTVLHALSTGKTSGLYEAIDYATKVSKGAKAINNGIEAIFKAGEQRLVEDDSDLSSDKEKIRKFIDKSGLATQVENQNEMPAQDESNFAEGGEVAPLPSEDSFSSLYPEQNMMLNTAKGRISTYLNSMKPRPATKLPYDTDMPNKEAERAYEEALDVAADPLSVLKRIQSGSLTQSHIKHLNSLYPELVSHLQKQLTKRVVKSQISGEKPSYNVIQSLSCFLANPLDSTITPASVLAAQSTFKKNSSPQQSGKQSATKRGSSTLGKSNKTFLTTSQAAESDRSDR